MKQTYKSQIMIILLFICAFFTASAMEIKNDSLRFSGKIINTETNYSNLNITITYNKTDYLLPDSFINVIVPVNRNNEFKFKLPDLNKPYKWYIGIRSKEDNMVLGIDRDFLAEPGDDIRIDILLKPKHFSMFEFEGHGAQKYNLVQKMKSMKSETSQRVKNLGAQTWNKIDNAKDLNFKLKTIANVYISTNAKKDSLISNAHLSNSIQTVLRSEYLNLDQTWKEILEQLIEDYPVYSTQILSIGHLYEDKLAIKPIPDNLVLMCEHYLNRISLQIAMGLTGSSADGLNQVEFYKFIKNNYTGNIRDGLINSCFFSRGLEHFFQAINDKTQDSLISDAIQTTRNPLIMARLKHKNIVDKRLASSKVIDANFVDLDGKTFDLKSLRGKVVLIDAWFTGCTGCAMNHSDYKINLYPKYKESKDFVVLSINADETKEKWLKGIKGGIYSEEGHLHVNTGGKALDHPFLKYYGVFGLPWLMLIDPDGTIHYEHKGPVNAKVMIAQIDAALGAKDKKGK